jgi:hypothetical protein
MIQRSLATLHLFLAATCFSAIPKEVVVAQGDRASVYSATGSWSAVAAVYLDETGGMGVHVKFGGADVLLHRTSGGIFGVLARSGQVVPGRTPSEADGVVIGSFPPSSGTVLGMSGGRVLIGANPTFSSPTALFLAEDAGLRIIARTGDAMPGRNEVIARIASGPRLDENGHVTFIAVGSNSGRGRLLRWTPEGTKELFPGSGTWNATSTFGVVVVAPSGMAVAGGQFGLSGDTITKGVLRIDGDQQTVIASGSDVVPGMNSDWSYYFGPEMESCNRNGDILFSSVIRNATTGTFRSGLWQAKPDGTTELLWASAESASAYPDGSRFGKAVINRDGDVAFYYNGLHLKRAGQPVTAIVHPGTAKPALSALNTDAMFFSENGNLLFAESDALWVYTCANSLRLVAKDGEAINYKAARYTLSNLSIVPTGSGGEEGRRRSLSDNGEIAFTARLTRAGSSTSIEAALVATLPHNGGDVAPVANSDAVTFRTPPGVAVKLDVLSNDTDANGDPLVVTGVSAPRFGKVAAHGAYISYTPNSTFQLEETLQYTIADPAGNLSTATVVIRSPMHASWGTFSSPLLNDQTRVGLLTLTVTKTGSFSGRMEVQGESFPLKGFLTDTGEFTKDVILGSGETLSLHFQVLPSADAPSLLGAVSVSTGGGLIVQRTFRSASPAAATARMRITAHFRPDADLALPGGIGFGVGTLLPSGRMVLSGRLPDNQPFAIGATTKIDGSLPFSCFPYPKMTGSLAGEFHFVFTSAGQGQWNADLQWTKQPSTRPRDMFPQGFGGNLQAALASYSTQPGSPALSFGYLPVGVFASEVGDERLSREKLTWSEKDVITFTPPNFSALRMRVNRATGLVSGAFKPEGTVQKRFMGAVFLPRGEAAGVVRGQVTTGFFTVTAEIDD